MRRWRTIGVGSVLVEAHKLRRFIEPVQDIGRGMLFTSDHPLLNPVKNIPPTNPTNDSNASPITGKTMIARNSMENTQSLSACGGLNKYICKYIVSINEKVRVQMKTSSHVKCLLSSKSTVLHNTKVTT